MAKKVIVAVRMNAELKDWINRFTSDRKRGMSGFVEDACEFARKQIQGKKQ